MKNLGLASVGIFIVSILVFATSMFSTNGDLFSGPTMVTICIFLPIVGLIAAFFSKKGALKTVGILGNVAILIFSVIIPAASTLFWNQP